MTDLIPPSGHHPAPVPAGTGIDSAILIHAPQSKVDRVAAFSRNAGITALYTVAGGNKIAAADKLLTTHRSIAGPESRILFDANRYSGKNRATGDAPLSLEWVTWQLDHGAPVALTDTSRRSSLALPPNDAEAYSTARLPLIPLIHCPAEYVAFSIGVARRRKKDVERKHVGHGVTIPRDCARGYASDLQETLARRESVTTKRP